MPVHISTPLLAGHGLRQVDMLATHPPATQWFQRCYPKVFTTMMSHRWEILATLVAY